jgi:uncharacterized protein YbaP (TraB family)
MRRLASLFLLAVSACGQVVKLPGTAAPSTAAKEPEWRPVSAASSPAAGAVPAQHGLRHGIFWQASSATNTVYLLGSLHAATPDLYPLPKQIEDAFRSATVLVVEVNLNKLDTARLRNLASAGFYPPGDSLWNHISARSKQAVLGFCARNRLPAEYFAALRPWMAMLIAAETEPITAGMSTKLGIDRHFLDRISRGMRVEQMETAEQQLQLFTGIADHDPERLLMEALQSAETDAGSLLDMQNAWLAGDTQKLEAQVASIYAAAPEFAENFIAGRNLHMAEVVAQHLNGRGTAFVVVGAAHLVGENGVVRLLERQGYRLDQIFSAAQ